MTELEKALLAGMKKAQQLALIACDWNLDEVEIDGDMVSIYDLINEFRKLVKRAESQQKRGDL